MSVEHSFSIGSFMPFVFPALIVGVFGLIIWGAIATAKKARANLEMLAARLGLRVVAPGTGAFSLGNTSLEGEFRGRPVRIYSYTTGSGKHRTSWCAFTLTARIPAGFSLKVSGENLFTKAGRIFGIDDVATGEAAFDEAFYVKSNQANYVRAALIPEVRMRLLAARQKHRSAGSFGAENGEVKYAEQGSFSNVKVCERIPEMLEIAADLAEIAEAWRE